MLLKDVRELLYEDVDTDNGLSPVIHTASDDKDHSGPLKPSCGTVTGVERDALRRVIRRTDANGHTTRFDYSRSDDARSEDEGLTVPRHIGFADGVSFDFHYTDTGVLEKFLTGHNQLASFEADPGSGHWKANYTDGTHAEFVLENGRIARAVNPSGTVALKYDDKGLLMSETFEGRTVTYHRNNTGHLIGLTTPFGQIIHYRRDSKNRVRCIKEWSGRDIRVDYETHGAMKSITYPNGTQLRQQSTGDGAPAELRLAACDTDEAILHQVYHRDHLSRITRISGGDHDIIYAYDEKGRLTGADSKHPGGGSESFTVDQNSNRLSDHRRPYGINAADRLVHAGEIEFRYDGRGNLIEGTCPRGHARYTYFGLNRLSSISLEAGRTQYRYDAFGRRVAKKVNGVTTRYFWAGNQLLHEVQRCATGNRKSTGVTDYLFFPGRPALLAIRRDQQTRWAAFGHRYEVLCLTANNGRPVWQAAYDSFGEARIERGPEIFQPFRLAGQYRDDESGLHYHLNRYYDPELGRYLSMTPLFLESGSDNFYAYGKGDPVNHVDTGGVWQFAPILIGGAEKFSAGGQTEVGQREREEMNIFATAKAALLGGVMNMVFSRLGSREEFAANAVLADDASGFYHRNPNSTDDRHRKEAITPNRSAPRDGDITALPDAIFDAGKGIGSTRAPAIPIASKPPHADTTKKPAKRDPDMTRKSLTRNISLSEPVNKNDYRRYDDSHADKAAGHVNVFTGEVTVKRTDFILAGRVPMSWNCRYQSGNAYSGLMGRGWQTPADARLEFDENGSVLFFDGGPTGVLFDALPNDTPTTAAFNSASLTAAHAFYQVRLKSGLTYHFPKKKSEAISYVARVSDVNGNFLSFEREATALTQILDNSGQHIRIRCEQGRICSMKRQDKPLVAYRYDGEHLTAAMDALGHQTCYGYGNGMMVRRMDRNKHAIYFKYAKSGQCIRTWDDGGLYEYRIDYPPHERRTVVTDSIGRKKTYTYDNPLRVRVEDKHTGAARTREYDAAGRIVALTDELNRSTAYRYDKNGNITEVIRADTQRIALTYDGNHRPVRRIDANGNTSEQRFDDRGRLTEEINPLGDRVRYTYNRQGDVTAAIGEETAAFGHDPHGLVNTVICGKNNPTTYQRDASGNITAAIDPTGQAARYVYDDSGRLIQAIQPSGISQSFDWDPEGNLLIHTDPNGRQTRFEYGVGNKIIRRRNPDHTSVSFQYDTENHLINIINERQQCHHSQYDQAGRVTAQTDYFGHTRRFAYDAAGQLIARVDPLGRGITYAYDSLGRLKTITINGEAQAFFKWDAIGNLVSFQSSGVSVERRYDAANRLSAEKKGVFSVDYRYDGNGRPTRRTTGHGNRVRYAYDARGAVSAIQINDHAPVSIERNDRGQVTSEQFSGSLHRSFSYDQDGLLTRQTINNDAEEIERRYSYDGAANLIAKQDSHKGDWRYRYDAMDRITETTDPHFQTHCLTYDPCGDLVDHLPEVKEGLRSAQYNNIRYLYDAAGNLVQRNDGEVECRFEWDEQNHLKTICKGDEPDIAMAYDALGRRHTKSVMGVCTTYHWDGHALISEQHEAGPAREYVYYPGTRFPLAVIDGDRQVYYYHNDINGLPLELTRPGGEIVWSADYDALGRLVNLHTDDVPQPLRLPGQYFDEEFNLCYDGRRYFDPATYAYISQYPLGPSTGENRYAYASNVWTAVDKAGFCKSLLYKTSLRKRHRDIKNACVLPVLMRPHKIRHFCMTGGLSPSTIRKCSADSL